MQFDFANMRALTLCLLFSIGCWMPCAAQNLETAGKTSFYLKKCFRLIQNVFQCRTLYEWEMGWKRRPSNTRESAWGVEPFGPLHPEGFYSSHVWENRLSARLLEEKAIGNAYVSFTEIKESSWNFFTQFSKGATIGEYNLCVHLYPGVPEQNCRKRKIYERERKRMEKKLKVRI